VPVFYCARPAGTLVASDIWTLLRTDLPCDLNHPAIDFFLTSGFVPAPWTLVRSIKRVPGAHVLCCSSAGRVDVTRYWRPVGQPKLRLSSDETTKRFSEVFHQALRRRYSSEVQNGLLLSGGIDSSLILAGVRKLLGASLRTFTFGTPTTRER
jgi:asparagine synthase (glutamine-hydrolysing)